MSDLRYEWEKKTGKSRGAFHFCDEYVEWLEVKEYTTKNLLKDLRKVADNGIFNKEKQEVLLRVDRYLEQ